jgi:hypothetical protein
MTIVIKLHTYPKMSRLVRCPLVRFSKGCVFWVLGFGIKEIYSFHDDFDQMEGINRLPIIK